MANGKVVIAVDVQNGKATASLKEIKAALGGLEQEGRKTSSMFKSMLGANIIATGITKSIGLVTNGVKSLYAELNSSSKAWKTFTGNMEMLGLGADEISRVQRVLQDFATKTIYSASDMASTYSQLAAVGIQSTDKLVTGFGGLAAAAENPKQAMKTLSTQAVQMAARPKVAWMDFKLMLEQAPAGLAQVAKHMGMSMDELVKAVQDGEVATQDFFDAISAVGNNEAFSKMATEFKTVDQAIDGLKEGLSVKLKPAFDVINKYGIKAVNKLSEAIEKIDFEKVAQKLETFFQYAEKYLPVILEYIKQYGPTVAKAVAGFMLFKKVFGIFQTINSKVQALRSLFTKIPGSTAGASSSVSALGKVFSGLGKVIGSVGKSVATIAKGLGSGIATAAKGIGSGLATAFRGLGSALAIVPPTTWLAIGAAIGIVCVGLALLALNADGVKTVLIALGESIAIVLNAIGTTLATVITALGAAIMTIGQGIKSVLEGIGTVIVSVGTAIQSVLTGIATVITSVASIITEVFNGLATVITSVGNAIATVFNSVATVVTSVGNTISSVLSAAGGAIESFGNAVKSVFEGVSDVIRSFGDAVKNILDGVANIISSVGDAAYDAGYGFNLLSVGIERLTNLGVVDMAATLGALALGIGGIVTASQGLGPANIMFMQLVNSMQSVSGAVTLVLGAFNGLGASIISSMNGVSGVVSTTAAVVQSSITAIISAFANSGSQIVSNFTSSFNQLLPVAIMVGASLINEANRIGTEFSSKLSQGIFKGVSQCQKSMHDIIQAVKARGEQGVPIMHTVGAQISQGLAQGMLSALAVVRSAADQLVYEAERAAQAKAKIHSPSRLFRDKIGMFIGRGVAVGIDKSSKFVDKSLDYIKDGIANYKFDVSNVLGIGGNLNTKLRVQSEASQTERNVITDIKTKADSTLAKALDLVDKALDREVVIDVDGVRLGKTIEPHITSKQNKDRVRNNRRRGEL